MAMPQTIWQCSQLSDSAPSCLTMLPAVSKCFLIILPAVWQCYQLSGNTATCHKDQTPTTLHVLPLVWFYDLGHNTIHPLLTKVGTDFCGYLIGFSSRFPKIYISCSVKNIGENWQKYLKKCSMTAQIRGKGGGVTRILGNAGFKLAILQAIWLAMLHTINLIAQLSPVQLATDMALTSTVGVDFFQLQLKSNVISCSCSCSCNTNVAVLILVLQL